MQDSSIADMNFKKKDSKFNIHIYVCVYIMMKAFYKNIKL